MAQVLFGSGITDMRGKVAGNYFRSNGVGVSLVTITQPTTSNSPGITSAQSVTAYLANYWSNVLTDAQRQNWFLYANRAVATPANFFLPRKSAQAAFQLFNRPIVECGGVATPFPIVYPHQPPAGPTSLVIDTSIPSMILTNINGPIPVANVWYITACAAVSGGANAIFGSQAHIVTMPAGTHSVDILPYWAAHYGSLPQGYGFQVKVNARQVNPSAYYVKAYQEITAIAF